MLGNPVFMVVKVRFNDGGKHTFHMKMCKDTVFHAFFWRKHGLTWKRNHRLQSTQLTTKPTATTPQKTQKGRRPRTPECAGEESAPLRSDSCSSPPVISGDSSSSSLGIRGMTRLKSTAMDKVCTRIVRIKKIPKPPVAARWIHHVHLKRDWYKNRVKKNLKLSLSYRGTLLKETALPLGAPYDPMKQLL